MSDKESQDKYRWHDVQKKDPKDYPRLYEWVEIAFVNANGKCEYITAGYCGHYNNRGIFVSEGCSTHVAIAWRHRII